MTIEFFTGFEGCGSDGDLRAMFDYYSSAYAVQYSSTMGFDNGKCLKHEQYGSSAVNFKKNVTATKTLTVGFHIRSLDTRGYDRYKPEIVSFMIFHLSGSSISLWNTSSGLLVYSGATQIASTATYIGSSFQHVEVKVFSDASAGTVQVKVDGSLILDASGLNTNGADITAWTFVGSYSTCYVDNLYIADDFQGELYSVMLKPSADVESDFTPSDGTDNYAMVDDDAQDGDTTYVQSDTVGDQDLYEYEDLDVGLIPVAISLVSVARKEGTGGRSLQQRAKQSSTEYDVGTDTGLALTYPDSSTNQLIQSIMTTAPDSSVWTRTILNAMQFGFKVSA